MTGRLAAIFAAALLLAGTAPARAGSPARQARSVRVLYGLEWGYDATVLSSYHRNYLDATDGFRIDEKNTAPMFYSNGHANAHVTLEFARRFGLGIYAGYAGIQERTRFYPLSLRFSYFFNNYSGDSNFVFLEGGAGVNDKRSTVSPFGKLGYGHRVRLTERASIDFSTALRCVGDNPPIYDPSIQGYVEKENIRRSDALFGSVVFAISLNF